MPRPSPAPTPSPTTSAPTPAPTTVWELLGGRYLAAAGLSAALVVVMCGCAVAFIRSLVRPRRRVKEQNATSSSGVEMTASSDEAPTATQADNPFSAASAWVAVAPNPRALPAAAIDDAVASHGDVSEVEVNVQREFADFVKRLADDNVRDPVAPRAIDPLGRAPPSRQTPAEGQGGVYR